MAQNGHHVASQETLKQFLLFIKKLQKAGLCTAPEVFAQQSCGILRVCHVQRTSKKMLRISDVSWYQDRQADQAEQGDLESDSLTVSVCLQLPRCHVPQKKDWFVWFVFQCVSFKIC